MPALQQRFRCHPRRPRTEGTRGAQEQASQQATLLCRIEEVWQHEAGQQRELRREERPDEQQHQQRQRRNCGRGAGGDGRCDRRGRWKCADGRTNCYKPRQVPRGGWARQKEATDSERLLQGWRGGGALFSGPENPSTAAAGWPPPSAYCASFRQGGKKGKEARTWDGAEPGKQALDFSKKDGRTAKTKVFSGKKVDLDERFGDLADEADEEDEEETMASGALAKPKAANSSIWSSLKSLVGAKPLERSDIEPVIAQLQVRELVATAHIKSRLSTHT